MSSWSITTPVEAQLNWDYAMSHPQMRTLYEKAKLGQWNASTDIDWSIEVPFGAPLPHQSSYALASFETSPLARRDRSSWDTFRWELQSWMVSQFLHGEQGALVVASRLVEVAPDLESKFCAASQAIDEARHVEAFSRYLYQKVPNPYPITEALATLLKDILADDRWDITALGIQIIVEALAMAAFRMANNTFHDDLIKEMTRLVARDEARHVSFGVLSLSGIYREMTSAEIADREDMVLQSASLMRQRFLLEDRERMEVDRAEGVEYAATNELMIRYRQAIFAKIVVALGNIGLMTRKVRDGLDKLDLLGLATPRALRIAQEEQP